MLSQMAMTNSTPPVISSSQSRAAQKPRSALTIATIVEISMKAIGTGWRRGVGWRDFENTESGDGLELRIQGRALDIAHERCFERAWLGASLTRTHALAHVVLEGRPRVDET